MLTPEETRARRHEYYLRNREKTVARVREYKEKNKDKVRDGEKRRRNNPEYLERKRERDRKYYESNRDRIIKQNSDYYYANKERVTQSKKKYRENHKTELAEQNREYQRLPEVKKKNAIRLKQYRARNRERVRAAYKKYYDNNKELMSLYNTRKNHKRDMRENQSDCTLTLEEWERILKAEGYKCSCCGTPFSAEVPATKDHIVPVTKSGGLTRENVQPLCLSCNSKKKDRTIDYRKAPIDWN